MGKNLDPEKVADLVEELRVQGYETLVAEMPKTGEVRIFVDAASQRYNKKVRTILPTGYKKKGTRWHGIYTGKKVTNKDQIKALEEKAKTDKGTRLRISRKPWGLFVKTGKIVTTTLRNVQNSIMKLRRKAHWKPLHHRPRVGPKLSRAVKKAWDSNTGKYRGIKQRAEKAAHKSEK